MGCGEDGLFGSLLIREGGGACGNRIFGWETLCVYLTMPIFCNPECTSMHTDHSV
jgi:hypothetical protein